MRKIMINSFLLFFVFSTASYAGGSDSYVIKLNKIINKSCRIILFSSLDKTNFFLSKFNLKDDRLFNEYQNNKEAFFAKKHDIFSYMGTLGPGSSDYFYSLENEHDIILKFKRNKNSEDISNEEAILFQNITCE